MIATSNDEYVSSYEEIQKDREEEATNLCFMTKEHYTNVMNLDTPIPYKLQKASEILMDDFHKVMSRHLFMLEEKCSLE